MMSGRVFLMLLVVELEFCTLPLHGCVVVLHVERMILSLGGGGAGISS